MHIDEQQRFTRLRTIIFCILIIAYMSVFFHRMAPAVVSAELMASFLTSATTLGSLAAMYYYIYALMQIPAGVLADTLGNRISVTTGNFVAGIVPSSLRQPKPLNWHPLAGLWLASAFPLFLLAS